MKITDFDYDLPEALIASVPTSIRDKSRLLVVKHTFNPTAPDSELFTDLYFENIIDFIKPNDLVIFNNSKVMKARLFGQKPSGGKIEILVERILSNTEFIGHVRSNKTINLGLVIILPGNLQVTVIEKLDGLFKLSHLPIDLFDYLEKFGHIPLPVYINRPNTITDATRYQTVYAKDLGSVAAPTAGLHFTQELLHKIKACGANIAYVTLHVGSGTFKPVSVENVLDHKMHSEIYSIGDKTIEAINLAKKNGGKIIAVGTTSLRTLETVARRGLVASHGDTDIFITPGFKFKLVDTLITNFHLPKSTLLMLVAAFTSLDTIKAAYAHAITNKYRFFSYGDAMLLHCNNKTPR